MAFENRAVECARLLLADPRTDPNLEGTGGRTLLGAACRKGDAARTRLLLGAAHIDPNRAGAHGGGATPLSTACAGGHTACARLLLAAVGTDPNLGRVDGATPLYTACENGHEACVRLLLAARGTDQNQSKADGAAPLFIACANGHAACARLLLAHNKPRSGGVAHERPRTNPNLATWQDGATPLYMACQNGHAACVRLLLETPSTKVNAPMATGGRTPLHKACARGHARVAGMVLAGGGCRFAKTAQGFTALGMTSSTAIRALFRSGADYWQRGRHGSHSLAMRWMVADLFLIRQRVCARANAAAAAAAAAEQGQEGRGQEVRGQALPWLPKEVWLTICTFLRSADFD